MRAMLEPFVRELGDVREELGRERERRERAEERSKALEGEMALLKQAASIEGGLEPPETVEGAPGRTEPRPDSPGPHGSARRPWWRRVFGG